MAGHGYWFAGGKKNYVIMFDLHSLLHFVA
jgi:hypothetical protein